MVKFGDTELPHVQGIRRSKRRIFDTKTVVGATVAAKKNGGGFGREFTVNGMIWGSDIEAKMLEIMALAGQAKKLDFEDSTPPFLCLMLTPRFREIVEEPNMFFYEVPFVQIESVKQRWLWDSAIISEILSGFLRPEIRNLSDAPIIAELLAGYLRPEIRTLSDSSVITELLKWIGNYTTTLQDSPVITEILSYETGGYRELFDSAVISEILSGMLIYKTPVTANIVVKRRQSPSYAYQAQSTTPFKEAVSPSYAYTVVTRIARVLRPDPPLPLGMYWFIDAISPSYEYAALAPSSPVRVAKVAVT